MNGKKIDLQKRAQVARFVKRRRSIVLGGGSN